MIAEFFTGFFVKIITGLDDTLTHTPIANLIKKKSCRIFLGIGILLAVTAAIFTSIFLSQYIQALQYSKYITFVLLLTLATLIYFDVLVHKPREKAEIKIQQGCKYNKAIKFIALGFFAGLATVIDDTIAYSAVMTNIIPTALGILTAAILEITFIYKASHLIQKIKYKKEISVIGLIIIAIITLL